MSFWGVVWLLHMTMCLQRFVNVIEQNIKGYGSLVKNICLSFVIILLQFLAVLSATAQQSYCRQAGVRRPSVRSSVARLTTVALRAKNH